MESVASLAEPAAVDALAPEPAADESAAVEASVPEPVAPMTRRAAARERRPVDDEPAVAHYEHVKPEPVIEDGDPAAIFAALLIDDDDSDADDDVDALMTPFEPATVIDTAAVVPESADSASVAAPVVKPPTAKAPKLAKPEKAPKPAKPVPVTQSKTEAPKEPAERKKPDSRTVIGIAAGFVAVAAILTAVVLGWYASQGSTTPASGGGQPEATASSAPEPTLDEPTPTVPPAPVAPEGAVGLTETARTADSNFFTITSVQRVDARSNADGSDLGSMLQITLAFANISDFDADLMTPTVTVTTGAERTPAAEADAVGTEPFRAWVGAGTIAQASYVFAVDSTQQTDISVTVTYGAGESVTFWGNATMFGSGQGVAEAGVTAEADASASSTEVEE